MMQDGYDVRAIANFVLRAAEKRSIALSNVSINKIVFFLHCDLLVETGQPLVSAKSEAWQYGPVYRELYSAFEKFGEKPITDRAKKVEPTTGEREECYVTLPADTEKFLLSKMDQYLLIAPFNLVNLSHLPGGPWDIVYNHSTETNPGMKIGNEVIRQHYRGERIQ
jgi:uncharacterized phage-associated protein